MNIDSRIMLHSTETCIEKSRINSIRAAIDRLTTLLKNNQQRDVSLLIRLCDYELKTTTLTPEQKLIYNELKTKRDELEKERAGIESRLSELQEALSDYERKPSNPEEELLLNLEFESFLWSRLDDRLLDCLCYRYFRHAIKDHDVYDSFNRLMAPAVASQTWSWQKCRSIFLEAADQEDPDGDVIQQLYSIEPLENEDYRAYVYRIRQLLGQVPTTGDNHINLIWRIVTCISGVGQAMVRKHYGDVKSISSLDDLLSFLEKQTSSPYGRPPSGYRPSRRILEEVREAFPIYQTSDSEEVDTIRKSPDMHKSRIRSSRRSCLGKRTSNTIAKKFAVIAANTMSTNDPYDENEEISHLDTRSRHVAKDDDDDDYEEDDGRYDSGFLALYELGFFTADEVRCKIPGFTDW
ncbi:hypothetical protein BGW41_002087 [Actinomortierella wolfii]|nr:hypothetical protein BGW41_002087 [Actinomortierella wolfii]